MSAKPKHSTPDKNILVQTALSDVLGTVKRIRLGCQFISTAPQALTFIRYDIEAFWLELHKHGPEDGSGEIYAALMRIAARCCITSADLYRIGIMPQAAEAAIDSLYSRHIPTIQDLRDGFGRLSIRLARLTEQAGHAELGERNQFFQELHDMAMYVLLIVADLNLATPPVRVQRAELV